MKAVKIDAQSNGAHRNQDGMSVLLDGWAMIPPGMEMPNFPFGDVVAEEIDGVMTVTGWAPGSMPESDQGKTAEQTAQDDIDAMMVDHEYRISLLELGLTE